MMDDDDGSVEKLVQLLRSGALDDFYTSTQIERDIERIQLFGPKGGVSDLKAGPLFQICDVQVSSSKVVDSHPRKIYGIIAVLDELNPDNTYIIYRRTVYDPDELLFGDSLTLDGYPLAPSTPLTVFVYLRDAAHDHALIANGCFDVRSDNILDYDLLQTYSVRGEDSSALVCYQTNMCACVATVQVSITKLMDNPNGVVQLMGIISARFDDFGSYRYELFKRIKPVSVVSGEVLDFSRYTVAGPMYSSIEIDLDLWDSESACRIVKTTERFSGGMGGQDSFEHESKSYVVNLRVKWTHVDELIKNKLHKFDYGTQGSTTTQHVKDDPLSSPDSSGTPKAKKARLTELGSMASAIASAMASNLKSAISLLPSSFMSPSSSAPIVILNPLVEVFSVFAADSKRRKFNICGAIRFSDKKGTSIVYKRDNKNPEILLKPRQVISMFGPSRSFEVEEFRLDLKFWDDNGRVVSDGNIKWSADPASNVEWYDRRICSIIQGEHGYAAVHYCLFSSGAQVRLRFLFEGIQPDVKIDVSGNIATQYDNYDYSTYRDREYYRSILFKKSCDNPVQVFGKSEIPISKDVVAAPCDSVLIVELDLVAVPSDGQYMEKACCAVFRGMTKFKAFSTDCQVIYADKGEASIRVSAEWSTTSST